MDEKTIAAYNNMAEDYDSKTLDYWSRFPNEFLHSFIKLAKGKVLDLGSGPGRDALLFKYHNLDVVCLDASEKMVALCKSRGLEAMVGDMVSLPFADNSFENVWAYTSLLHLKKEQIPTALTEIHRVMKPNGVLGVGLIEGSSEGYMLNRETEKMKAERWFTLLERREAKNMLEQSNFAVTEHAPIVDKNTNRQYIHFLCTRTN